MHTVFQCLEEGEYYGLWGIECDGGLVHDPDFNTQAEAQAFADAYNQGARTYEEAMYLIYGLPDEQQAADEQEWLSLAILAEYVPAEPQTVGDATRAVLGEGPEFGTAAWYDSMPMIDPETGETENS